MSQLGVGWVVVLVHVIEAERVLVVVWVIVLVIVAEEEAGLVLVLVVVRVVVWMAVLVPVVVCVHNLGGMGDSGFCVHSLGGLGGIEL